VRLAGWPIVGVTAVVVLAVVGTGVAVIGPGEAAARFALRATARTSVLLFLAAFTASSLHRRWPGPVTRWLVLNRRYLGVSFAVSHAVHALAIASLVRTSPDFTVNPVTAVAGGFGYVVLAAMTATSFDRTAAWLGPRRWSRLHTFGVYYLWLVFFATYAPQAVAVPAHAPFTLLLLAALGLRLWARRPRPAVAVG
jgi:sulfoxide reductase heme-binding subunit YedZ